MRLFEEFKGGVGDHRGGDEIQRVDLVVLPKIHDVEPSRFQIFEECDNRMDRLFRGHLGLELSVGHRRCDCR